MLSHPLAEEQSFFLFEIGAKGAESLTDHKVQAFFEVSPEALAALETQIQALGFQILESSEVQNQDWVSLSLKEWKPIQIGELTIKPVDGSELELPQSQNQIYILPGMGFGTGEHQTTALALKLLQLVPNYSEPILDLGTGSGILAIALAKRSKKAVLAIDNDPQAIQNAAANVALNHLEDLVETRVATLEKVVERGPFGFIVANISADILCELSPLFEGALRSGALLLLSGIASDKAMQIKSAYPKLKWECSETAKGQGWEARLMRRL